MFFFALATSGGTLALQKQAPTGALADKLVDARLNQPFNADANDYIYQWDSSRATIPPRASRRSKRPSWRTTRRMTAQPARDGDHGARDEAAEDRRLYLIPASAETTGHGTTAFAPFYKQQLQDFLQSAPKRAM